MHDAILIGVGTAMNDNPQLNGRFFAADKIPDYMTLNIICC